MATVTLIDEVEAPAPPLVSRKRGTREGVTQTQG